MGEGGGVILFDGLGSFFNHMDLGHSLNHIQSRQLVIGLQERIHERVMFIFKIF